VTKSRSKDRAGAKGICAGMANQDLENLPMKPSSMTRVCALALFGVLAHSLTLSIPAHAQSQAATTYDAWNNAFLVRNGTNTYYTEEETTAGTNEAKLYTGALDIAVAEDVYQQTHSEAQRQLIVSLMTTFLSDFGNGTEWSYDNFNDDLGWMVNATLRAYQYTGDPLYLTTAEQNWNLGYDRGWNKTLGGGIEEQQGASTPERTALANDNFAWEGATLYQLTGDVKYLKKAKSIYAWVESNLFNATTVANAKGAPGQVNEGIKDSDGSLVPSDNTYNSGSFLTAATILYRVTGDEHYFNDAQLALNHVISEQPILKGPSECCGNQWAYWFTFGLSQFATETSSWSVYQPYLLDNANSALSERNSKDLTGNDWTSPTTETVGPCCNAESNNVNIGPDAVEMGSAVAIWQHLPPPTLDLTGTYEIQNAGSGLALNISGASKTNGAQVIEFPFSSGSANALWTFVPTGGGYYRIMNVNSRKVIDVLGKSAQNAATLIQSAATKDFIPGSDEWLPVKNTDGTYSFYNFNSLMAIDIPDGSAEARTQLDQSFGNSTAAQKFNLIPQ
jgi:hypothetical protein